MIIYAWLLSILFYVLLIFDVFIGPRQRNHVNTLKLTQKAGARLAFLTKSSVILITKIFMW